IAVILSMIDQAFDHKSWHGTNLKGSVRGLNAADAAWRPGSSRHNVWEIVVHTAYWKYVVRRRLLSEKRGSFPLKGSNWIKRPSSAKLSEDEWKADLSMLNDVHRSMRETISGLSSRDLNYTPRGSKVSNVALITGVAAHDFYHAGQIQLLKRLRVTR
ncbi:MAG TPA: DinB family protein, partial [Blastocatellia bacterium]|nr:DinB family protein [Blastocatellia bacterium]